MALCINQSGTYRNITTLCINQSGTYRDVTAGCINDSGTYRMFKEGPPFRGASYEGGFLICKQAPNLRWVVSPYSSEVTRSWYDINDANTKAQQVSGCTGWFVPDGNQIYDPGYICRSFWGPSPCYSIDRYWNSSGPATGSHAYNTSFPIGGNPGYFYNKTNQYCVRAFRCVTY